MEGSSDSRTQSCSYTATKVEQRFGSRDGEQINDRPPPKHPILQLQRPFEESIAEALQGTDKDWAVGIDAQSRRKDLLENPQYERLCGRKWRQRVGERYHPLWKLTAQMTFGLHLLAKGTAKSSAAVLKILQAHVDEMDGFVSRTTEDFLIIQVDLRTRIQYLSLPLENLDLFDEMLTDRNFRLAMINYNDHIELAIERFTLAVNDALKDIRKGKEAVSGLWQYLAPASRDNTPLSSNLAAIYGSMLANVDGWNLAFSKLRKKGLALQYAITQLGRAITEMQRRVGVASRKDVVSFVQAPLATPRAKSMQGLAGRGTSICISSPFTVEKPLPRDPAIPNPSKSRRRPGFSSSGRLTHQKSVPNLGATRDNCRANDMASNRAKSISGAPSRGSDSSAVLPRLQRTLSRRFSKAKLTTNVTVEEVPEESISRPSTSASRILKSSRKSKNVQQQLPKQTESPWEPQPSDRTQRPDTFHTSAKSETMKDQFLQYLKTDRVLDVWESITEREKKAGQSAYKRGGLWSQFQVKLSGARSDELQAGVHQNDIQKQTAWLEEETKNLNTYCLRPKHEAAPRVHTILGHTSLQQQPEEQEYHHDSVSHLKALDADDQSIITALPAFPLPPIGQLPESAKSPS
ncbi:uncharacterized protein BJX67DRAFT_381888 [Aspergillus lucknowensis]|uniref:Uncharacterized protein n=1 Tax=Aspergillus lucknowensis TaxID=176173 RepID=A0ABR4LPA7_9EURO